jgi:hypothetical protein
MGTKKMATKTVLSNHTRARVGYVFDVLIMGKMVSHTEVKSIVLRALAGEFDNEIELKSERDPNIKLTLAMMPDLTEAPLSTRQLADEVWAHGELLKTSGDKLKVIATKIHGNMEGKQ